MNNGFLLQIGVALLISIVGSIMVHLEIVRRYGIVTLIILAVYSIGFMFGNAFQAH